MMMYKTSFSNSFRLLCIALFVSSFVTFGFGQTDPDPNSPEPILVSVEDSARALVEPLDPRSARGEMTAAYAPNSKLRLYVGGLELMNGEGPDSLKFYGEDASGRFFQFPVLELTPSPTKEDPNLYSIVIAFKDELGFWDGPSALGDLLVSVSWRGLISNRLLLGYGRTGGMEKLPQDVVPMPLGSRSSATDKKVGVADDLGGVGYRWSGDRRRFLEQATFGPTDALDSRIRRIGLRTWLAEQFEATYAGDGNDYPNLPLKGTDQSDPILGCGMFTSGTPEYRNCQRTYYGQYTLQNWFYKEAFYGNAQLRHRVAWALSQLWVTSGNTLDQSSWMIAYHKILSQNAFGNYRTLMKEMTLNPGMGEYLNMRSSTKNNPNENYPRELLQLFTVGTVMLNQNGTPIMDNGHTVPTYDQDRINQFTKVFTGWRRCDIVGNAACPLAATDVPNFKDPMLLVGSNHDLTAKTLFTYPGSTGTTEILACTGCTGTARDTYANASLDQALDNIFYHPNVAPFVSKFLIQHLVMSDPSPAYVGRISAVFNNNGVGVRGDLKAVVKAILLDPEARGDRKTDPKYGKLREPVQYLTNIARHFNVRGANGTPVSDGVVNGLSSGLSQNAFYSPSVFNYYSPQYIIPGGATPGPEFGLMNTGTSIARANLVNTLVFGQIGTSESVPLGTSIDLTEMEGLAAQDPTGALLVDTLDRKMLHSTMSSQMRTSILTAVTSITASNSAQRARQALYLVASSSQFQVQR